MIALKGYENIKPLYHGSRACLYSATHTESARAVMLKHIVDGSPSLLSHFKRDFERIRRISSDHVAKVYNVEKIPSAGRDELALVYERVAGSSLKDYLSQKKFQSLKL